MGCIGDEQQLARLGVHREAAAERPDEVNPGPGLEGSGRMIGRDEYLKVPGFPPGCVEGRGEEGGAEVAAQVGQDEATGGQPPDDLGHAQGDPYEGIARLHVCDQRVCLHHVGADRLVDW